MIDIMREHLKHTGTQELPIVYPLIFFTGEKSYCVSTDLFDLFGEQKTLAKEFLFGPYQLIDVTQLPDEQLESYFWSGLMTKIMKYIRNDDLIGILETTMHHMRLIAKMGGRDYTYSTITYCFEAGNIQDEERLIKLVETELSEEIGENVMGFMSLAQQYMERGKEQGRLIGLEEGIAEGEAKGKIVGIAEGEAKGKIVGIAEGEAQVLRKMVLKLLQQGASIDQIMQLTELSAQDIEEIKRQNH